MKSNLVQIQGNQALTTSLIIAENCDNKSHESAIKLIRKHLPYFEEFGRVHFEIQPFATKGGLQKREVALLNEDHATFLITLFRNTQTVVKFKVRLVKEFRKAIDEINRLYANPPRTGLIRAKRDVHKDMMNALIEYRDDLGKETESKHFMCENKLCNGVVTGKYIKCNESELSNSELELLTLVRKRNEAFLMSGIDYQERKKRLIAFAMKYRTKLISAS